MRPEYPRRACVLVRAGDAWVGSGLVSPSYPDSAKLFLKEDVTFMSLSASLFLCSFIHSFTLFNKFIAPLFCIRK